MSAMSVFKGRMAGLPMAGKPLPAPDRFYKIALSRTTSTHKMVRSKARNKIRIVQMRHGYARKVAPFTGTASVLGGSLVSSDLRPEHLTYARHVSGSRLSLRFADGLVATLDLAKLGIDASSLRLATAQASSWGSAVEVEDQRGKAVHIDSAVLRSYCDPKYAAVLRQAIAAATAR